MLSIKGLSILFLFNLRINKKKKAIQCKKGRQRRLFMYWVSLKRKERQRNCVMRWNLHKNTAETFLDRLNNWNGQLYNKYDGSYTEWLKSNSWRTTIETNNNLNIARIESYSNIYDLQFSNYIYCLEHLQYI